jgi:D-3-phosphoglycerate dehydrogenase
MMRVLISDALSPQAADIFKQRGLHVDVKVGMTPDELKACIGDYHGLAIRSATKVTADIIGAAKNLKVVGRAGIGVDNVDIPAATAKGIVVMNTPFGNSVTTAEHAIAMMFALARDIPVANASTHAGKWEKSRFMGVEITAKTLGVIGCGNIGSIVAQRANGLGMKVIAFDPFLSQERANQLGVEKVDLDTLLARADFITLHTPLNDKTRHILNKDTLAKTKKGVRLINCARGGLIDEIALQAALDSGHVAGAALDVFEVEPAKSHPLFGNEKVVATPHLGASTNEAQENVALQVAEQMADFLTTGAVTNALNMPSVSAEEAPILKPYLALVDMLGSFAGQLTENSVQSITLEYAGHVADLNTKPLTAAAVTGLLKPLLDSVNMVNAMSLAKERKISVTETKHADSPEYQNLVSLTVKTDKRERTVRGTVFGGHAPRIVNIENIPIEAALGKHMLFVRNLDKPGFIGALGKALGDAGINIATFTLGPTAAGENAIALVETDQTLPPSLIDTVAGLPHVVQAKALQF